MACGHGPPKKNSYLQPPRGLEHANAEPVRMTQELRSIQEAVSLGGAAASAARSQAEAASSRADVLAMRLQEFEASIGSRVEVVASVVEVLREDVRSLSSDISAERADRCEALASVLAGIERRLDKLALGSAAPTEAGLVGEQAADFAQDVRARVEGRLSAAVETGLAELRSLAADVVAERANSRQALADFDERLARVDSAVAAQQVIVPQETMHAHVKLAVEEALSSPGRRRRVGDIEQLLGSIVQRQHGRNTGTGCVEGERRNGTWSREGIATMAHRGAVAFENGLVTNGECKP